LDEVPAHSGIPRHGDEFIDISHGNLEG
jgi:hypothetical protein